VIGKNQAFNELANSYKKHILLITNMKIKTNSDWGSLVHRTNVENVIKLGFILE
jgi:hypothetical protein